MHQKFKKNCGLAHGGVIITCIFVEHSWVAIKTYTTYNIAEMFLEPIKIRCGVSLSDCLFFFMLSTYSICVIYRLILSNVTAVTVPPPWVPSMHKARGSLKWKSPDSFAPP
ncbi:hypothetical protein GOODEAATRI_028377 [Goodea atripinnis]|uniref:Uncharacterized protein n=1 Tax=Goodea atripinnis TaxID=208336 RepID=A0ABV0P8H5_9TELE